MRLTNDGETAWLHRARSSGFVTLALYRGTLSDGAFVEAASRNRLPRTVAPGQSVEMEAVYHPPADGWHGDWRLDLVNEGCSWFNLHEPVRMGS